MNILRDSILLLILGVNPVRFSIALSERERVTRGEQVGMAL